MTRYVHEIPARRPTQSETNRIEEGVVHYLLERALQEMTDRGSAAVHPSPWTPRDNVRVGVLGVTFAAPPATGVAGTAASTAATTSAAPPVENRGVIGLDFIVQLQHGASSLELNCEVLYALYHPLWPDPDGVATAADQQARASAGRARARPTVPIQPAWIRDDRAVLLSLAVPVPAVDQSKSSRELAPDPLLADAQAAVAAHYSSADAARKMAPNNRIAAAVGMSPADVTAAIQQGIDATWTPLSPEPELKVVLVRLSDDRVSVSVSLLNSLQLAAPAYPQDLQMFDAQLSVAVLAGGTISAQELAVADDDVRYREAATVIGRGRGCVAREGELDGTPAVVSDTLPVAIQLQTQPRTVPGADVTFAKLAVDPLPQLHAVAIAMRDYLAAWDPRAVRDPQDREQQIERHKSLTQEAERFELGLTWLRRDPQLLAAFQNANEAFARANPPGRGWRLFQLVFIISQLLSLAARVHNDPALRSELDYVDVLWFPTGGGKTEAYLGLITTALFYDRARGKERGATAWLAFPLRMLSVQQLARLYAVLHHAEAIRSAQATPGDPFTLGYLVGKANTPNRLERPDGNWPGIVTFAQQSDEERDERRLIGACPACGETDSVGLDADLTDYRLLHVCRNPTCGARLGIYMSDEEVHRYQPSVLVSTVDKVASFARDGELTAINRGPEKRCPQHGWVSFRDCQVPGCKNRSTLPAAGFVDATPAIFVQDELHLVREELGAFTGHYQTLLAHLATWNGNLPSKVITATATIEQYEDQLRQVYGRRPRMYPTGGPSLADSFYGKQTDEVRRVYVGVLPAGGGTAKVDLAGDLLTSAIKTIQTLQDDPQPLVDWLANKNIAVAGAALAQMLFDYELGLAYVNAKAAGVQILELLSQCSQELTHRGQDTVRFDWLSSETALSELARIIASITGASPSDPRNDRYRALVGTSVVSHGIDLERLNVQVLAGMPPSYAHYIQAASRSGRSHVGLVATVFDRYSRRESSIFQSFAVVHAALDRMVEPVPVSRFATLAVRRTLPGIACAILWDEARNATSSALKTGIYGTRFFKPWWNANAAALDPVIVDRIRAAYRSPVAGVNPLTQENELVRAALDEWSRQKALMQRFGADNLPDLFAPRPMTSLRDVDSAVEIGALPKAQQVVDRLVPTAGRSGPASATPSGPATATGTP